MNDRYGVDPCAAGSLTELASLLRQFGPEHGRFIFDFPSNWYSNVRDHFRNAGDVQRTKLTELWLSKAKTSILPAKVRYSADFDWAQNAAYLKDDARGLIGPAGSRPPCRALEDVLVDPDALPNSRGGHIPRTARAYVEVARPLLQISKKIVLVDPYFRLRYRPKGSKETRPSHRHIRFLRALIQAAQAERQVEVIKLMVSPDEAMVEEDDGAEFKSELRSLRESIGGAETVVEHGLLDAKHSLDRHPRYLLGNECGLRFDWGFDTQDDGSTQHVEWVGGAALKPLLDRFM